MGVVGDVVSKVIGIGGDSGGDAARASKKAAATEAQAQMEALEYLKEKEAIPRQFSEAALKQLAGIYGLPGGTAVQESIIQRAMQSPLYKHILAARRPGEEGIRRSAAATGGLRSGDIQSALYDYNTQLTNKALLESYNQIMGGLTGMAGLDPGLSGQIAGLTGQIGATRAAGITGAAQAEAAGQQAGMQNLLGLGQLGLAAYGAFSDRRLKTNIVKVDEKNGFNWYTWTWNNDANKLGLYGNDQGVIAQEIKEIMPEAVSEQNGYLTVDYSRLGV